MKKTILLLIALLPALGLFSQRDDVARNNNLRLSFEVGTNIFSGSTVLPEQIRQFHSSGFYYDHHYGFFFGSNPLTTAYFGVKPEYFVWNNRLGLSSGLRLTTTASELTADRGNFLWKVSEQDLITDYVQIRDIKHRSYLIGIPLEARFFPNRRELPFQHYFRVGASLNYRVHSKNNITFANQSMTVHDKLIQSQLNGNNINNFSAFAYAAIGFKIGSFRNGRAVPWGNIEFQFPYYLLSRNSFAFVNNDYSGNGIGISFSYDIPIGRNVPIGTR